MAAKKKKKKDKKKTTKNLEEFCPREIPSTLGIRVTHLCDSCLSSGAKTFIPRCPMAIHTMQTATNLHLYNSVIANLNSTTISFSYFIYCQQKALKLTAITNFKHCTEFDLCRNIHRKFKVITTFTKGPFHCMKDTPSVAKSQDEKQKSSNSMFKN